MLVQKLISQFLTCIMADGIDYHVNTTIKKEKFNFYYKAHQKKCFYFVI